MIGGERVVTVKTMRDVLGRFPDDRQVVVADTRGRLTSPVIYQDTAGLPGPEVVVIEGL